MRRLYKTRTSFVLDMLNRSHPSGKKKVLDVGFIGDYQEADVHYNIVDSLRKEDSLIGIDVDAKKLDTFLENEKTKQRQASLDLQYKTASIFHTGIADKEVDSVLMLEVFEHLSTPYSSLEEIKRILKPGGSLIMTYPNPLSLSRMIRFITRKNLLQENYLKTFRGAPDHKILPHPICLAGYLNDMGFSIKAIKFIKYDIKRLSILNWLLARCFLTKRFASYVGICATKI